VQFSAPRSLAWQFSIVIGEIDDSLLPVYGTTLVMDAAGAGLPATAGLFGYADGSEWGRPPLPMRVG